ncbi:MAG: M4 family metallopeptidase [Bacteroidales bacterium]|nr:M4 family metallopeptidase [Bacteroidales bacterium]
MRKIFTLLLLLVSMYGFSQQVEKQVLDRNGYPTFVKFNTKAKAVSKSETKAVLSSLFNMTKNDEYRTLKSEKDKVGFTHEKFQQYYKGVKVEYGVYIVHSRNNVIETLNGEYKVIKDVDVTPTLSKEAAIEKAKSFINAEAYKWDVDKAFAPTSELVVVANDYGKHPKDAYEMVLAYKIDIYATKPLSRNYVYVNAHTGEIVHVNAIIKNAVATGSADTRYSGTKTISTDSYNSAYRLRDYSRGNGIITYNCKTSTSYSSAVDFTDSDNSWTSAEYDNTAKDNGALDAHWAAMVTYDYWQNYHGRNSFDNNGASIKVYVHYDSNYENAYWDGSEFTFGDGGSTFDILTSLDVFGHEFGHAVCENTCNLTYSKEPGALNEAFSDIWGCTIEHYYAPDKETWNMGEDLGYVLRSLSDPKSKSLPDTYQGDYWVTSSSDYYGVHTNNGPFCYWYYLISEGGSGTNDNNDSYNVTAIGIDKAEQITFRVESVYMTSSSNYANARTYAIQAAQDLYGEGSQEEISVTNAMYAIGVGEAYDGSGSTTGASYCESKGSDYSYEWIASVSVGDFTKTSTGSSYSDYTSSVIDLNAGETYSVTLTPGFASSTYNEYWKVWIDYDNDTTFSSDELVFDAGAVSKTAVTGSITIPSDVTGVRRMRVSMKYNGSQDACETFSYGEVEDYNVNISQSTADTQAPTAPTNLSSSGVTQTTATLSWTASTDNVGVTGYDVYKNGSFLASSTSTSYSVTGLTAATTYTFYVKAKDAAGNVSAASSTVSVTTQAASDTEAPTAPTNLAASSITQTTATLSWTASTDNVGVTGYDVYKNGSLLASTTSTSYSVTGLTAATTYTFYVKAKDAAGNVSAASSTVSVTTQAASDTEAPTAPTNLAASSITQTTATLSWTASTDNVGVTGYDVYKNGSLLASTTSTSYSVTGLTAATTYTFYVKAKDAAGNVSAASSTVSVTTSDAVGSYCTSKGSNYSYEWIAKVQVGSYTNSSSAAGYTDFTSENITMEAGSSVAVTLTPGFASSTYNEYWKIWIDYNHDYEFSDDELAYDAGAVSKSAVTGTISVPSDATGSTRMRVSMKYNGSQTACETFSYGEVEDYTVTFGEAVPDTEAPSVPSGLTSSGITSSSATISWTASTDNVGVTGYEVYQNGSLVSTVTTTSYTATGLSASTSYSFYVKAKDAAGNVSAASSAISVTTSDVQLTYCTSKGNNVTYEWIDLVQLNEISNTTTSNGGYADFTSLVANVSLGSSQTIYFSCGFKSSSYTEYWQVWVDWDHSGTFDTDEKMASGSSSSSGTLSGTFTVPSDAVLGTTRMRVTMKYNSAATACETFSYGEVEDYTVNVTAASYNNVIAGYTQSEVLGNEPSTDIVVYPNPASSYIRVKVVNGTKVGTVSIYNMQGALVKIMQMEGNEQEISVSELPAGSYLLSVEDERGAVVKPFIKR